MARCWCAGVWGDTERAGQWVRWSVWQDTLTIRSRHSRHPPPGTHTGSNYNSISLQFTGHLLSGQISSLVPTLPTDQLTDQVWRRVNITLHICWASAGVGPCQRLLQEIRKVYNLQVLMSILGIVSTWYWLPVLPAIFQICHATLRQAIVQLWWLLISQGIYWCQSRRKVVVTSVLLL